MSESSLLFLLAFKLSELFCTLYRRKKPQHSRKELLLNLLQEYNGMYILWPNLECACTTLDMYVFVSKEPFCKCNNFYVYENVTLKTYQVEL